MLTIWKGGSPLFTNQINFAWFYSLYNATQDNCKLIFVPSKKNCNSKSCDEFAVHHVQWKTSENESPATSATTHLCSRFSVYTVIIKDKHSFHKIIILFIAVGHSLAGFVWNKIYQTDQILPSRAKGWCITKLHSPQTQFPASLIRSGRMF